MLGAVAAGQVVSAQQPPAPELKCGAGDLIYARINTFGATAEGDLAETGAATADEALGRFLNWDYPRIGKSEFSKVSETPEQADFSKQENGAAIAQVQAIRLGDSWEISKFRACNRLIIERSQQ